MKKEHFPHRNTIPKKIYIVYGCGHSWDVTYRFGTECHSLKKASPSGIIPASGAKSLVAHSFDVNDDFAKCPHCLMEDFYRKEQEQIEREADNA